MKRRDLILASAGALLPALGRAAQPCPPPQISVAGGGSATTNCAIVSAGTSYSTNFALTENPLSEGGIWKVGKADGGQWNDPRTSTNRCYASTNADTGSSRYADDVAHLKTSFKTFSPNQFAQATVFRQAGYSPAGGHEVELLLRFTISANDAHGYEILWGHSGYIAIVRWNGPLGSYTPLFDPGSGSIPPPVEGDTLRAEIVGNIISAYRNGSSTPVARVDVSSAGTVYASGQPGVGFWPVDGSVAQNLGWKAFSAGDL
jgi:hypothetical protein